MNTRFRRFRRAPSLRALSLCFMCFSFSKVVWGVTKDLICVSQIRSLVTPNIARELELQCTTPLKFFCHFFEDKFFFFLYFFFWRACGCCELRVDVRVLYRQRLPHEVWSPPALECPAIFPAPRKPSSSQVARGSGIVQPGEVCCCFWWLCLGTAFASASRMLAHRNLIRR